MSLFKDCTETRVATSQEKKKMEGREGKEKDDLSLNYME